MKMSLNALTNGFVTLCDGVNLVDSLHKTYTYRNHDENQGIRTASILNRLAILGFKAGESIAQVKGANPEKLRNIKSGELFFRVVDLPIKIHEVAQSEADTLRFLERAVVAPISDVIRVSAEVQVHEENHYLREYEKDPQNSKRPVFESDEEGCPHIVGYRSVDPKECKENIKSGRKTANISAVVRIASEVGIGSKSVKVSCNLYERLAYWIRARINNTGTNLQHQGPAINLIALNEIPQPLENDVVFRRYTCAISQNPIRDPVGDPNGHTLYERSEIMAWLNRGNYTSPITRLPLRPRQLIEKPVLKRLIENRLTYHGQHLLNYIQANPNLQVHLNTPVDPNLQAAVDQENPHN